MGCGKGLRTSSSRAIGCLGVRAGVTRWSVLVLRLHDSMPADLKAKAGNVFVPAVLVADQSEVGVVEAESFFLFG